jgi:two-component system, OmpR family, phosphate regulon sensor histidine kinase PhoR
MNNKTIIRVVIFGALAIISIIAIQAYLLMSTWDAEEKAFQENVTIALQNVAEQFEKLGSPLPAYDLINQVSSNYYVVDINDFIDANNLEYFLRRELEQVGLREDFEYGIYNCDTRKMAYGKYISYTEKDLPKANIPKAQLPVHEKFLYYFGVRFPHRTTKILSTMRLSLVFSGILVVTILFFLYSMFIILRQKRLSEMQKDFINNMTHEFKTPISTIRISADVFMNSPEIAGNKRLLQYATIIKDQNGRLNRQVEKVLQLARIERDNFKLNKEDVDLHEVLTQILESTRLRIEKQGGTLNSELRANNAVLPADKLHLTNILYNLLDNATKYCGEAPDIEVGTSEVEGGKIKLSIKDCGIGIQQEYLSRIFEKFYRVPTGDVHNVKGFGLGLFYTKSVCNAHGWKISIDSKIDKGTTVSIVF